MNGDSCTAQGDSSVSRERSYPFSSSRVPCFPHRTAFLYLSQYNTAMKRRYTISDHATHKSKLLQPGTTGVGSDRFAAHEPKMPRLSAAHHSYSLGPQRIEVTTPAEGRTRRSVAIRDP